jgi:hypothetical protein
MADSSFLDIRNPIKIIARLKSFSPIFTIASNLWIKKYDNSPLRCVNFRCFYLPIHHLQTIILTRQVTVIIPVYNEVKRFALF